MKLTQKLIFILIAFFIIITMAVSFSLFHQVSNLNETHEGYTGAQTKIAELFRSTELDDLAQQIKYYDEVLTQSARNYAFTQNVKWKTRYRNSEKLLDASINAAIEKGDIEEQDFFYSVNTANVALVNLESESIELVDKQQTKEAIAILEGKEYAKNKDLYYNSLQSYVKRRNTQKQNELTDISNLIDSGKNKNVNLYGGVWQNFFIVILVTGICSIVLGFFIISNVRNIMKKSLMNIKSICEKLYFSSDELFSESQSVVTNAIQQSSSLEKINDSLKEIIDTIEKNTENANTAQKISLDTLSSADLSTNEMKQMDLAINDIKKSTDDVAEIIKIIDNIAFQTNVLALNASVEAARAGEYGKGFVVVANEVRQLANRTATSAKEITRKINDAIEKSEQGVKIVLQVADSLQEILGKSSQMHKLMKTITIASKEQVTGIGEINQGIGNLDDITQNHSQRAQETASISEKIAIDATSLRNSMEELIREI